MTPQSLKQERDREVFFARLSLCLLAAEDLALISIWNPNAFLMLLDYILQNWETLLESLAKSSNGGNYIPRSARPQERRRDLLTIFNQEPEPFAQIWPNLTFLSCWADGPNAAYAERLQSLFPNVQIQGKGLIATEAIITIPFERQHYLPTYQSHFLEFLPDGEDTECLLLHQLRTGQRYQVVLTTSGGLYRYRLGDIVTVTGHYHQLPLIQFVSRDRVLDHFGEKLNIQHLTQAIDQALQPLKERLAFMLFGFEFSNESGYYCLYLEMIASPHPVQMNEFSVARKELSSALQENFHYSHAIDNRQLQPLQVFLIDGDGVQTYFHRLAENGMRIGDVKTEVVSTLADWSTWFHGAFVAG